MNKSGNSTPPLKPTEHTTQTHLMLLERQSAILTLLTLKINILGMKKGLIGARDLGVSPDSILTGDGILIDVLDVNHTLSRAYQVNQLSLH